LLHDHNCRQSMNNSNIITGSNDTFLLSFLRPATISVVRRNRSNRKFSASCQNASYRAARIERQIKQLEAAFGIYLFDRAPRRLHLTIEGRELAGRLPALFSQIDYLTETVKGASTGGTGLLRIGDAGVLTTEVIAPALRRLRKHWPNLRLSAVQNTSEGFFHDLLENRIDCAFPALEPKGIDLTSHKLCKLEIGLVLPPDHRLADQSEIRFERLRNERWILPPREFIRLQTQNPPKIHSSNSWIRSNSGRNMAVNTTARDIPRMTPTNLWGNRIARKSAPARGGGSARRGDGRRA
jgi:LysR substrate binding domain